MNIKTKTAVAGIITTTVLLFAYITFRSGSIENEYVKTLSVQTERLAIAFSGFEKEKPAVKRNFNRFLADMGRENPNMALLSVADASNMVLAASKNDRYLNDRALFDEITMSFSRGEFAPVKGREYTIRYFEQTKFYIYVKETPTGKLLIAFPYKLRGKLMVKLLLEITLIAILAVIFTTAIYLYLTRRGQRVRTQEASPASMDITSRPETRPAMEHTLTLKNPSAEALKTISALHIGAGASLYILDQSMTRLEKHLEFAHGAHVPMEGSMDSIDITDEIGEALIQGSMLVLNRGRRLIIPITHRGGIIGAVDVSRGEAFSGPEISAINKHTAALSRMLITDDALLQVKKSV